MNHRLSADRHSPCRPAVSISWAGMAWLVLMILLLPALSACGGGQLARDRQPQVVIEGATVGEAQLQLSIGVRNLNEVLLDVAYLEFDLEMGTFERRRTQRSGALRVPANSREYVPMILPLDTEQQQWITGQSHQQGIHYRMWGKVHRQDGGPFPFRVEGRLYPVPGRPGEFR